MTIHSDTHPGAQAPNVGGGDFNHHSDDHPFAELYLSYRPRQTEHWEEVRDIVIRAVQATRPISWAVAAAMLFAVYKFVVWSMTFGGVELNPDRLFTERNLYRYAAQRDDGRTGPKQRVEHGLLGRVVETQVGSRPRMMELRRSVPEPYTRAELASTISFATSRPTDLMATTTLTIIAFGAGAGLETVEMESIRGIHIHDGYIGVPGVPPRARRAPVLPEWREHLRGLAACGDDYVLLPHLARGAQRSYRSLVTGFLSNLTNGKPSTQRLRATWIHALIERGVGPSDLIAAAGFATYNALDKYAPWMPPPSLDRILNQLDNPKRPNPKETIA